MIYYFQIFCAFFLFFIPLKNREMTTKSFRPLNCWFIFSVKWMQVTFQINYWFYLRPYNSRSPLVTHQTSVRSSLGNKIYRHFVSNTYSRKIKSPFTTKSCLFSVFSLSLIFDHEPRREVLKVTLLLLGIETIYLFWHISTYFYVFWYIFMYFDIFDWNKVE